MRAIEFYMTPKGEVMLREEGKPEHQLKETDYDFISSFLNVIEEFYPDAYKKLMEEYARSEKRRTYRDFLAVRRFVKCNMGNYDSTLDLDENWNFKFEHVSCPLRGECTGQGVISLLNFKGQRDYSLNPTEYVTNVHATNGAGKSTICDAWSWLWTGKDAKGRADYEIKTNDTNNEPFHHLEHTVMQMVSQSGAMYEQLQNTLLDTIKRVQENKEYIPQASAINETMKSIIDLEKVKVQTLQLLKA